LLVFTTWCNFRKRPGGYSNEDYLKGILYYLEKIARDKKPTVNDKEKKVL
jgi:hypothetical protein